MDAVQFRIIALLDGVVHITVSKLATADNAAMAKNLATIAAEAAQAKGRVATSEIPADLEATIAESLTKIYGSIHGGLIEDQAYDQIAQSISALPGNPVVGPGAF